MAIASFKGKVFRVSGNQLYTLSGMTWGGALDTEAQEKVGDKPSTYIKGYELDTMSFSIPLRADLGHDVRAEIESWESIRDSRNPDIIVLGTKPIGRNKWLLKSVTVSSIQIDNKGRILSATLDLEFEEYVRAGKKMPEQSASSSVDISQILGSINLVPQQIYNPPSYSKAEYSRANPNVTAALAYGVRIG